ncbi:hypothetical protein SAMN06298216_3763 [Spirosomataceae bacterium TFI 002]|nr:hypothetical protein SAMN06298216_3763 [Spirosomataceae bacterium TFI 002]
MKNLYSLFLLTILSTTLFAQTTRRVNGDPNITGINVYNTIQAAVDAANTDDVILIEPYGIPSSSNSIYSEAVQVDKKLHFRGNGYYLTNPELTINTLDPRFVYVGAMTFDIGSAGSSVKNLYVNSTNIYVPNVLLESSRIGLIYFNSYGTPSNIISSGINTTVRKCLISSIDDNRGSSIEEVQNLNLLVENSMIASAIRDCNNSIIKNCHIGEISSTSNSIFTNCIVVSSVSDRNNSNNSISYCISFANDLPTQGNNTNNILWQQLYSGSQYFNDNSFDGENDLKLSNSSIGKNAGINGGDIGIYGGTYPYEKSGLPHHPINTFFINSGIGNNTLDLDAVITIKAN